MEINISRLFQSDEYSPRDYSASVAEIGANAGQITWQAAMESEYNFLDTQDKLEAFRDHIQGFGAWSDEEITAWNVTECNALFVQLVSGDIREAGLDVDNPDWDEYYKLCENGQASGNLFKGVDGNIYYYLGS